MKKVKCIVFILLLMMFGGMPVSEAKTQSDTAEETSATDVTRIFSKDILKAAKKFRKKNGKDRQKEFNKLFTVFPQLLFKHSDSYKEGTALSFTEEIFDKVPVDYTGITRGPFKKETLIELLGVPDETRDGGIMVYKLRKDGFHSAVFIPFQDSVAIMGFENVLPETISGYMKSIDKEEGEDGTDAQPADTEETSNAKEELGYFDKLLKYAVQFRNTKGEDRRDVLSELLNMNAISYFQIGDIGPDKLTHKGESIGFTRDTFGKFWDEKFIGSRKYLKKEGMMTLLGEPNEIRENGLIVYKIYEDDNSPAAVFVPIEILMFVGYENVPPGWIKLEGVPDEELEKILFSEEKLGDVLRDLSFKDKEIDEFYLILDDDTGEKSNIDEKFVCDADGEPSYFDKLLKYAVQFRNTQGEDRREALNELLNMNAISYFQIGDIGPDKLTHKGESIGFTRDTFGKFWDEKFIGSRKYLKKEGMMTLLGEPNEIRENGLIVYKIYEDDNSPAAVFIPIEILMFVGYENVPPGWIKLEGASDEELEKIFSGEKLGDVLRDLSFKDKEIDEFYLIFNDDSEETLNVDVE